MLIVFGALIATVSLIGIGIDWIGRPLRGRRFVPRIYRYDDEIPLDSPALLLSVPASAPPAPAPSAPVRAPARANAASRPAHPPVPTVGPEHDRRPAAADRSPVRVRSRSAFSDSIGDIDPEPPESLVARPPVRDDIDAWSVGMALDTWADGQRPTMAVRAERFWQSVASKLAAESPFDHETRDRLRSGRPPRRRNPRTGELETMQLVGLRAASRPDDVRMHWPDDTVDPWSGR